MTKPILMANADAQKALLLRSAAVGVTAAVAFGAPAYASDGQPTVVAPVEIIGQIPQGEVESPKSTAPVMDMPQTISVITQDVFEAQGARNLTDVLNNTPGITFNAGENGFSTGLANFSMRGFDTSGSIFIDGVRDSGSYSRDAFNIERVEVFKGPSGDGGRGGAGGYINIVTRMPSLTPHTRASVSYGFDDSASAGRLRATADINRLLAPGVAARINLLVEDGGVAGVDFARHETFGFAPSLSWGLGEDQRLSVALQYVQQNDIPSWGVPAAYLDGMLRYDAGIDGESLRDTYYGLASDFDDTTSTAALVRYERGFGETVTWTNQLRWSQTERMAAFTVVTGYAPATQLVTTQRQTYDRDNQSLSLLSNLSARFSTGGLRHNAAVGLEYSNEQADARAYATLTNPGGAAVSAFNPDPYRFGAFTAAPTELSSVEVSTISAYAYDTIDLSPQWQVTGGLRLESYEVDIASRTAAGAPTAADGLSISETTFSGRLGLVFTPIEGLNIYGGVSLATQPPASFLSNSDISRGGDNAFPGYSVGMNSADAEVQESLNFELGVKWRVNPRLDFTAALFRTERSNVAITGRPTVTDPVELLGYGEHIVQGVELGLSGQITPEWSVFAGLLLMESERRHDAALDLGRCRANPADYGAANAAACNSAHVTSGDELAFTPEVSATVWTTYEFPFGLTVGGGVRYMDEVYVGRPDDAERIIPNGSAGLIPSYWVANAMAEYEISPNVSLRLNIDNLTDEFYAVSTNWAAQRISVGPPRTALLTLRLRM